MTDGVHVCVQSAPCLSWLCDGINWANTNGFNLQSICRQMARLIRNRPLRSHSADSALGSTLTQALVLYVNPHEHKSSFYISILCVNGVEWLELKFSFFFISVLNLIQITVRVPRCTCGSAFVCLCDIKESHSQSSIFIAKYYISKLNCWCHISW